MQKLQLSEGQRFGLLTIVGPGEPYVDKRGWKQPRLLCRCDCGNEISTWASSLIRRANPSCGCTRNASLKTAGVERRQTVVSYFGMHRRLGRDLGKASQLACVDCGGQARTWSYDNNDPDELHYDPPGKRRLAYSLDPSRYSPRCRACHNRHDGIKPPPTKPGRSRRRAAA